MNQPTAALIFAIACTIAFPTAVWPQSGQERISEIRNVDGWPRKPAPEQVDWTSKRFAFEMRAKTWRDVLEWFAEQAQMPFSSPIPPPSGTLTFINPKDKKSKPLTYSLAEIYDI